MFIFAQVETLIRILNAAFYAARTVYMKFSGRVPERTVRVGGIDIGIIGGPEIRDSSPATGPPA
jgi:hypothetical protein